MDLQSIGENHGYATVLVGTFLEEEIILILAGLAAPRGIRCYMDYFRSTCHTAVVIKKNIALEE